MDGPSRGRLYCLDSGPGPSRDRRTVTRFHAFRMSSPSACRGLHRDRRTVTRLRAFTCRGLHRVEAFTGARDRARVPCLRVSRASAVAHVEGFTAARVRDRVPAFREVSRVSAVAIAGARVRDQVKGEAFKQAHE